MPTAYPHRWAVPTLHRLKMVCLCFPCSRAISRIEISSSCKVASSGITDQRSMAGTAPTDSHFTRTLDAGPVQCSVWLCRLAGRPNDSKNARFLAMWVLHIFPFNESTLTEFAK